MPLAATRAFGLSAAALAATLCGCAPPDARWEQDVYVWQRVWTQSVSDAVRETSPFVDRFRVLSAQWRANDVALVVDLRPDADLFRGAEVVPVVRLDGSRLSVQPKDVAAALSAQVQKIRAAGARVTAVEIDHDTATAAVGDYAAWLGKLRGELPRDLELWITALPDWRHSPNIEGLLDRADRYTLQVHAVIGTGSDLMNGEAAERWVRTFSQLSETPFHVALPTYQLRAGMSAAGDIRFLEAEAPLPARAAQEKRLFVAPAELIEWQRRLKEDRPQRLEGIAWYRLPIEGDRSVISTATFQAMLEGRPPETAFVLTLDQVREGSSTFDIAIVNRGIHDGAWPGKIDVPQGCRIGETANGFVAERRDNAIRHPAPGLLKTGEAIAAGYLRCSSEIDRQEYSLGSDP
jgi:hypothetical protein